MNIIQYREGYKYQLVEDYSIQIPIVLVEDISDRFIKLRKDGLLSIRADYAWDGPSGPTRDTPDSLRASLVHDALYGLLCERLLDISWRSTADEIFYKILLEDGMDQLRTAMWYEAVRLFGASHTREAKLILTAPRKVEPNADFTQSD